MHFKRTLATIAIAAGFCGDQAIPASSALPNRQIIGSSCGVDSNSANRLDKIALFDALFNPTSTPNLGGYKDDLVSFSLDQDALTEISQDQIDRALNSRFLDSDDKNTLLNLVTGSSIEIDGLLGRYLETYLNENCEVEIVDEVSEYDGYMNHILRFFIHDKSTDQFIEFMHLAFSQDSIYLYCFLEGDNRIEFRIDGENISEYNQVYQRINQKYFFDQMSYPEYYLKRHNINNLRGRVLTAEDFKDMVNDSGEIETNPDYMHTYRVFLVKMIELTEFQSNLDPNLLNIFLTNNIDYFKIRYRISSDGVYTFDFLYNYGDVDYFLGDYSISSAFLNEADPLFQVLINKYPPGIEA